MVVYPVSAGALTMVFIGELLCTRISMFAWYFNAADRNERTLFGMRVALSYFYQLSTLAEAAQRSLRK